MTGKYTPWSDSKSSGTELGGSVDRNYVTPPAARTVLVQLDADVTVVGESRVANFVHGGTPRAEGATVNLPKSVFVRVSEDVAREMGLLPNVTPNVPKPDFPRMAPPSTVVDGEPGALGLSTVESVPDLSSVVADLTQKVNDKTARRFGDPLVPNSVLKDSMSNLQRIVDLSSPASVKAMIDSALDGGVPLLVHQPGTFGKDSFQVTLRAKAETPRFQEVVNDGVDMEHTTSGTAKVSDTQGRGSGWGVGIKAPGLAAPGSANPNVSGTAGVMAGANVGKTQSRTVGNTTTDQFSHARSASGPAARYTVPIEFELVVERGDKLVAKADSGKQEMTVRLHADNQKVVGGPAPTPYQADPTSRPATQGTPDAATQWQQDGSPAALPPTASVENLRGARDLRDAAVQALRDAGAGKGLTGKGTGSLNVLLATLSPENLQPHLPGMLSGPLNVPGLHEAALTFGQDADVKVYAKLVNPTLSSLSDGVQLDNPKTQIHSTTGDVNVTESADVSVGLATGGAAVKQGTDPKDTINFGASGVEVRHANDEGTARSGGLTENKVVNVKQPGTTGLVRFDVEYRVVATIGGKTGVVDLAVPGSAAVRMPATEAQTVLGNNFSQDLTDAQAAVKDAATDWRTAEKDVDIARHEAQQVINDAAPELARNDVEFGKAQTDLNTAIDQHLDAEAAIPGLETTAETARREVARTRETIQGLTPQITSLSQDALNTMNAIDDVQADVDAKASALSTLENQLATTPDSDVLWLEVQSAREAHAASEAQLRAAEAEADAAHDALTQAQQQLTDAHADLADQRRTAADRRAELLAQQQAVTAAEQARTNAEAVSADLIAQREVLENGIRDAETKLDNARRDADGRQQAWWDAKAVVDQKVTDFNAPPATVSSDGGTDGGSGGGRALPPIPPDTTIVAESRTSDQRTRQAPVASTSTETVNADTANADAESPETDVPTEVDNELAALTVDAMDSAPQLENGLGVPLTPDVVAGLRNELVEMYLLENDIPAQPEPTPPSAPAPADTSTTAPDADATPRTEAGDQLAALTTDAMANATPQMQRVADVLASDPRLYLHATSGTRLLEASVVLHTRTDEIAALFDQHGLEPVARAFNNQFERPVIEREQLQSFQGPDGPANFQAWAHGLWDTIGNLPDFTDAHVEEIFNHDKGFNRANNFAQQAGLAAVMGNPALDDAMRDVTLRGTDTPSQAAWVFQVLSNAGLIDGDGSDRASQFDAVVQQNRADLAQYLGGQLSDQQISDMRQGLVDMYLLDDDTQAPSAPPAESPGTQPPADPSPLHSTADSAPWFDPRQPVPNDAITQARTTTPASSWVRGEDGGVLNSTTISPDGRVTMQPWRGPIAYDNRVMNVDGVPVRDFTVRLHLNNGTPDVQERTRAGVEELYNQGYRLPNGEQFHVTVEFTDNPADAHATVEVAAAGGRANQLSWPVDTDQRRLAHEVGHFLGLRDEYLEPGAVKPIFQHQDGRGRVVGDDTPMTAGIDAADAKLKPRHLQLVENRMKALETVNRPAADADVDTGVQAPNMPPKRERSPDQIGESSKRGRNDDHEFDPAEAEVPALVEAMQDVDMQDAAPEFLLNNENGVQNTAFEGLANGRTLTPITAENYLGRTRRSIANNEPPAFVVNMIVRASDLGDLDRVITAVMQNAGDSRVAFVLGVNAGTQTDITKALADARATLDNRPEPIALVSVPHGKQGFKYGDTRNRTMDSNAHKFAVHALSANGSHPYVSIMDFDDSDRTTRQGDHVFEHVARLMDAEEVGPADGPDVPAPLRPLMVGGGYRNTETMQKLHDDIVTRIDNDPKTDAATRARYRARLDEAGFLDGVLHDLTADMHARRTQSGIHPFLPYTPEPNLFIDALIPLADPKVRFGDGGAEFGKLGKTLNEFYAKEIASERDSGDPQQHAADVERVKIDVENNRHPVRGQAFTTDFVDGDTGTDVSRMAYGKIKDGNISQSHTILSTVPDRLYLDKGAKKGTSPADARAGLQDPDADYRFTEPFREPHGTETKNSGWHVQKPMDGNLGSLQRNKLNAAVSAPMPPPFTNLPPDKPVPPGTKAPKPVPLNAGLQHDERMLAAHGLASSDHVTDTVRHLRHMSQDVLNRATPPPTTPDGLYAAVGQISNGQPGALRAQVINNAAADLGRAREVADFSVGNPMHPGHLYGALVENLNWRVHQDPNENTRAANARNLLGRMIASELNANVHIHRQGLPTLALEPFAGPGQHDIHVAEVVTATGHVTYRRHP